MGVGGERDWGCDICGIRKEMGSSIVGFSKSGGVGYILERCRERSVDDGGYSNWTDSCTVAREREKVKNPSIGNSYGKAASKRQGM